MTPILKLIKSSRPRHVATLLVLASMVMFLDLLQLNEYSSGSQLKNRILELTSEEEDDAYHQKPVMHTFYDPLPQQKKRPTGMSLSDDRHLLKVWADSWKSMGWRVRILTMEDVKKHPNFDNIQELLQKVHLGKRPDYDRACYLRWFAITAAGGGWMSDFDVIPLPGSMFVNNQDAYKFMNDGNFTVYDMTAQGDPVPSLMSGSLEEWDRLSNLVLKNGAEKGSEETYFSDFRSLIDLKESASIVKLDDVVKGHNILKADFSLTEKDCNDLKNKRAIHISHRAMRELKRKFSERPFVAEQFWLSWLEKCSGDEFVSLSDIVSQS